MPKPLRIVFIIILVASAYHFIRDVLQTFDLHSFFTNVAHRPHEWCGQYCDVVTIPFDVISIVVTAIVLHRDRVGALGVALLASLPLWLVFTLLP